MHLINYMINLLQEEFLQEKESQKYSNSGEFSSLITGLGRSNFE